MLRENCFMEFKLNVTGVLLITRRNWPDLNWLHLIWTGWATIGRSYGELGRFIRRDKRLSAKQYKVAFSLRPTLDNVVRPRPAVKTLLNVASINRRWRSTVGQVTVGVASRRPCARNSGDIKYGGDGLRQVNRQSLPPLYLSNST